MPGHPGATGEVPPEPGSEPEPQTPGREALRQDAPAAGTHRARGGTALPSRVPRDPPGFSSLSGNLICTL